MKQQLIVSGMGGQGVLFLTRVIAEAGVLMGLEVLTAETHGMAQRGGSVLSTVKVGAFHSPLVRRGCADAGLFLHPDNLEAHGPYLRAGGRRFVNTSEQILVGGGAEGVETVDATGLARDLGDPLLANLVLLGRAVSSGTLFCDTDQARAAVLALSRGKRAEANLAALERGLTAGV
jgi:indolepyruvate ferredoxin oxidoreductase beta subunit